MRILDRDGDTQLDDAEVHFQKDGGCPHNVLPVSQWLDNEFLHIWIERRILIGWPAIQRDIFLNVRREFVQRLYHCLTNIRVTF